jgi:putative Mg2+ transporter-C (MgtC) family protein
MINQWLTPLSWEGIATALACGFIVGFERQWNGKPSGIRTSIMICMGAYLFVSLAALVDPGEGQARVIGQIVTGIGFLGAGVIIARNGFIHGITSAAVIWELAAIGSLIGVGSYIAALLLSILTVIILVTVYYLEGTLPALKRGIHRHDQEE